MIDDSCSKKKRKKTRHKDRGVLRRGRKHDLDAIAVFTGKEQSVTLLTLRTCHASLCVSGTQERRRQNQLTMAASAQQICPPSPLLRQTQKGVKSWRLWLVLLLGCIISVLNCKPSLQPAYIIDLILKRVLQIMFLFILISKGAYYIGMDPTPSSPQGSLFTSAYGLLQKRKNQTERERCEE